MIMQHMLNLQPFQLILGQHFLRVKPCDLWIVIDHASFNGNCTLSKLLPRALEELVTGNIGTQLGVSLQKLGPR